MKRLEDLTPGQAHYILGRVVADKKIRSREIDVYLGEMDAEIRQLENRLSMLRDSQATTEQSEEAPAKTTRKRGRRKGRKKSTSSGATAESSETGASKKGRKGRKSAGKGGKRGSRKALTPEAQKSRQLQGQYISLIKRFSGREKEKFRKMASDKGREEAIKQMRAASEK